MKQLILVLILTLTFAVAAAAKVNINTASVDELSSLPGIGQAKAEAIVKHRKEKGKFTSIEQLTEVKGIGEKMLNKMKKEVTVDS